MVPLAAILSGTEAAVWAFFWSNIYIYIYCKKEGWAGACVLFKRTQHSCILLGSWKECCVLCILLCSLEKNAVFCAFFYVLKKRMQIKALFLFHKLPKTRKRMQKNDALRTWCATLDLAHLKGQCHEIFDPNFFFSSKCEIFRNTFRNCLQIQYWLTLRGVGLHTD